MIRKLWYALASIRNYDRIPKLPRGMLATEYDPADLARPEREILARLGARDPRGIQIAMRRYDVKTLEELRAVLEHQRPRRRIWHRLLMALARLAGGHTREVHADEIRKLARRKPNSQAAIVEQRIKNIQKELQEE